MLEQEDILKDLKSLVPDNIIKVNEPLKRYTYTKTGGNADFTFHLLKMSKYKLSYVMLMNINYLLHI